MYLSKLDIFHEFCPLCGGEWPHPQVFFNFQGLPWWTYCLTFSSCSFWLGAIHKLRRQDFANFWLPLTSPSSVGKFITCQAYVVQHRHLAKPLLPLACLRRLWMPPWVLEFPVDRNFRSFCRCCLFYCCKKGKNCEILPLLFCNRQLLKDETYSKTKVHFYKSNLKIHLLSKFLQIGRPLSCTLDAMPYSAARPIRENFEGFPS